MIHQSGQGWAILAVFCILTIFFFPATYGPYSVVHGPVSALRPAQAALRLQLAIIQAALGSLATRWIPWLAWVSLLVVLYSESRVVVSPDCNTIFRC